jgi:hypothetical protein
MMQRETAAAMEAIADFSSYRQLSQTHSTGSIRRCLLSIPFSPFLLDNDRPRTVHEPVAARHSPHVPGFVHLRLAQVLQPSLRTPAVPGFPPNITTTITATSTTPTIRKLTPSQVLFRDPPLVWYIDT